MEVNEAMDICYEITPGVSIILLTISLDRQTTSDEILKNPEIYLEKQRITKIKGALTSSVDILTSIEEIKLKDEKLKNREALLAATLESTADGVLVVDNYGKIVSYNQNFIKMWKIPDEILIKGEDSDALDFVTNQLKFPEEFLKRVKELYSSKDEESYDVVDFADGRTIERFSKPQKIDGITVGRVWSFRDITEAKSMSEKISNSLKEKEMMLREIHHRVKNNLQIISSLLKLQSLHAKDPESAEHFRNSQNRVKTMAMIHEKLYRSIELSKIEFGTYINELAKHILISYSINPDNIKLIVNVKDIYLDIDTAIPCGLLINEVVSNSLKYAFPNSDSGTIEIELYLDEDNIYNLFISDNGIGLPKGINPQTSDSLGLKLINTLARQLGSKMEVNTFNGTKYYLRFPPIIYSDRRLEKN